MASTLKSTLEDLASQFASDVLNAVRSVSLQELLAESGASAPQARTKAAPKAGRASGSGRLKRRSSEDIEEALEKVVSLVKKNGSGLRAEQIRETLGMRPNEMPRVLAEGIAKRKLSKKGQKRATTYFAR